MATLHYEKITANAIAPAHQFDGTFEVYSDKSVTVVAGDSARVTTGLRILAPAGTSVRTVATSVSWSHNVFPDSYCSMNFPSEITNKKGQVKPTELIILIRNMGMVNYEIKPGQAIARLEFVPILQIKSLETTDINSVAMKPATLQVGETEQNVDTVRNWFINKYTENPDSVKQWIKDNVVIELQKYKESAAYAGIKASTRPKLEANLILRHMTPDVMQAMRREFEVISDGKKVVDEITKKEDNVDYGDDEEEAPKAKPQPVVKAKAVAKPAPKVAAKPTGKVAAKAKAPAKPPTPEDSEEEIEEDDM
jgi:dUTPase